MRRWIFFAKTNPMHQHIAYPLIFGECGIKPQCHHLEGNIFWINAVGRLFDRYLRSPDKIGIIGQRKYKYALHANLCN